MYEEYNTRVIIDALISQIKQLRLDILIRDTEIKRLKEELAKKEETNG